MAKTTCDANTQGPRAAGRLGARRRARQGASRRRRHDRHAISASRRDSKPPARTAGASRVARLGSRARRSRIGPHWPASARIGRAFTRPTAAATSTALSALAANRRPARRRRRISPHDGPEAVRLAEQGASPACRRCPRRASCLRLRRTRRTRRSRRSRRSRRKRRTPRNASHPSHPAPHLATRPRQSCAAPRIAAESCKKRRASPPQNA
nr:hypothetical protein X990_752 [Burkholderia pseudomallei MSHR4868]